MRFLMAAYLLALAIACLIALETPLFYSHWIFIYIILKKKNRPKHQ